MFLDHFHMNEQPFIEQLPVPRILQDERFVQGINRLKFSSLAATLP